MKLTLFLFALPALGNPLQNMFEKRAACNAVCHNCARAVTGTAAGLSVSQSRVNTDCSSFQQETVYPSATTITITSGSEFTTIQPDLAGITIVPSSLPSYVSKACTPSMAASARFASACSCAGVTVSTTIAPTPTATNVVPAICGRGYFTGQACQPQQYSIGSTDAAGCTRRCEDVSNFGFGCFRGEVVDGQCILNIRCCTQ